MDRYWRYRNCHAISEMRVVAPMIVATTVATHASANGPSDCSVTLRRKPIMPTVKQTVILQQLL
jgi:hypothetical protein